ncbi:MAG: lysophospholipid acyltransferase family protein [Taibaiella sp.]|nr:lysophospholipid acyltransferase family protein [Taibaiella sp.]
MYYLLLSILYPLSLLPLRLLYLLADAGYGLVVLTGYRKQEVWENLKHAFPDKSDRELLIIMRQFYKSFCDQWVETIKLLSISKKALDKRITGNWHILQELSVANKNSYVLLGHTFNWEWASVACQYNTPQQFAGVYMPVNSTIMNRLMAKIRTRGGGWLISMKARKGFRKLENVHYTVGLIADQNPSNMNGAIWLPFMNREAPFFRGPALLAQRANAAVVFAGIKKVKRGRYTVKLELLTPDAGNMDANDITLAYVSFMEKQLNEQPANWLWTHKRWKYKKPVL